MSPQQQFKSHKEHSVLEDGFPSGAKIISFRSEGSALTASPATRYIM